MNSLDQPVRRPMHPLVAAAAVGIIALSAVGISVLLYNRSQAQTANPPLVASSAASAPAASAGTVPPPPAGYDNTAPLTGPAAPSQGNAAAALAQDHGTTVPVDANGAPLGADAVPPGAPLPPAPGTAQAAPASCGDCAIVVAERPITVQGRGTGLGAVGGGVAGGLIGNTIGHGRGNVAMTLIGAAGGALAGNAIEEHARSRTEYQMTVRFPDGREKSYVHSQPWGYQPGQTVRVERGRILAFNQPVR
jgi:outer membrane lipoprotein SlyB